jgi:signal peptidase I
LAPFAVYIAAARDAAKTAPERSRKVNAWLVVGSFVLCSIARAPVGMIVRAFFVEAFKIPSAGDLPTLVVGDHVFVDKLTLRRRAPRRGELITFPFPEHPDQIFTQRVVALPGDTVQVIGWLVLGSNMSGKSTFLRALAINAILAQSIATATCERYDGPPLVVRTLVDLQDDVLAKRSLFLAEAQAAHDVLIERKGEADRLCVVDELFRGTNTVDRVAAGSAFLRALRRRGDTFAVAATHDAELVGLLAGEYLPHHFEETIRDGEIAFDYRLRTGPSATRNALAILALVGFPPEVLDDAAHTADAHRSWRESDRRPPSS